MKHWLLWLALGLTGAACAPQYNPNEFQIRILALEQGLATQVVTVGQVWRFGVLMTGPLPDDMVRMEIGFTDESTPRLAHEGIIQHRIGNFALRLRPDDYFSRSPHAPLDPREPAFEIPSPIEMPPIDGDTDTVRVTLYVAVYLLSIDSEGKWERGKRVGYAKRPLRVDCPMCMV